jgi:hypothetical protein
MSITAERAVGIESNSKLLFKKKSCIDNNRKKVFEPIKIFVECDSEMIFEK